ncbi:hypothetical protein D3C87_1880220 [compost metagenome]
MNTLAKTFAAAGLLAVSTFTMAAAKSEVIAFLNKQKGEQLNFKTSKLVLNR